MYINDYRRFAVYLITLFVTLTGGARFECMAQHVAVKSNLLYDASSSINLGTELKLANKMTLDVSGDYNPWTFSDGRKMKHLLVQPELRWWTCSPYNGFFFGIHSHFGIYNWSGLMWNPDVPENRFQGWLAGAGVGLGYNWAFSKRWGMEAEIGAGYAYLDYDRYPCKNCGTRISTETKHYIGPTKAAVSLYYILK